MLSESGLVIVTANVVSVLVVLAGGTSSAKHTNPHTALDAPVPVLCGLPLAVGKVQIPWGCVHP